VALVIPTIFATAISGSQPAEVTRSEVQSISRACAIILLLAFAVYVVFQMVSHHSIYDDILEKDEAADEDRELDMKKDKLTLIECIIALVIAITFVALMAIYLVQQIPFVVEERGVKDAFLGLILVPLVEKAAEHLTALDEAHDNQMNFALSHVLGASIQTALLNAPLVMLVGWATGSDMSFEFELFDAVVLILAILVVGNFLRDGKSNYLEGALSVLVYVLIATCAFYYPNPITGSSTTSLEANGTAAGNGTAGGSGGTGSSTVGSAVAEATSVVAKALANSMIR